MNKLKTEKGFTLTEVLLAMVIMAIGVVGIFSLQTYSVQTLSISESRLIAQQIGKRYLEEAKIKALIIPETSIGASGLDCGGDKPCPKIISSSGEVKEFATRGISYSVLYKVFKAENSSQCNPGNL